MMKLTVAFLAALAAADAAEARSNRLARRNYDTGYGGGYDTSPAVSSAAHESPVPYVQSSAEVFETSKTPADAVYPSATPTPAAGGDYGAGYGAAPPAGGEGSKTPLPAQSSAYGDGFSSSIPTEIVKPTPSAGVYPPAGGESGKPSGVYPPAGGEGKPSGAAPPAGGAGKPSGAAPPAGGAGKPSGYPAVPAVPEAVSSTPYATGYPAYPTGTGSSPASSTPLSDYVTKTIYSTQIFTKTACPSTVTDCPAKSTALVTSVVAVGTTVCPESEYPEATPVKVSTSAYPVSEVTNVVTETLVYTVGVGSSAHPVTTEVVSTSTSTIYQTVVVTLSKPTPTPAGGEGYPVYPEGEKPTGTSTIKSTTTSTKYITVKPTPSNVPVGTEGTPVAGEDCPAPVTVTVTSRETVTVTKGSEKPTGASGYPTDETPAGEKPTGDKPTGDSAKPSKPAGSYPEYPASSAPAVPTGKYPVGNNGTAPYPAGPTGFKTSTKPAYPTGTGYVPTKPSETSSLPYFSLASELAYPTEPAKTPSDETKVPYSSAPPAAESSAVYPPAGGEYGSGYGAIPAVSSAVATPYPSEVPSKTPTEEQAYPTPAGNGYGSGYGTY
ncbi:hypothetical protein ACN47E_010077 [Coniothyrium glycines]